MAVSRHDFMRLLSFVLIALILNAPGALAGGFRGGGGHAAGGRVGGGASLGGMSGGRASIPHMGGGGGSRPASQAARPNISMPNVSRPAPARPSVSRPSISKPSTLPSTLPSRPATRPGSGGSGSKFPGGGERPSGGLKPSLPSNKLPQRPTTLPGSIGGRPTTLPGNRPTTLPERPTTLPERPGNRPTTLPGNLGSNGNKLPPQRPTTLPGNLGDNKLPGNLGGNKLPGNLGDRPTTLPGRLPESRPTFPSLGGGGRPTTLPGKRPSPGDIGDFLGLPGQLKPGEGLANRPGNLRPGMERPSTLPAVRPGNKLPELGDRRPVGIPGRPGINQRPINIGNLNVGNTLINNRPSWVNIDQNRFTAINRTWAGQVGGLHRWAQTNPNRVGYWNGWANGVRVGWNGHRFHNNWFAGDWWYSHPGGLCSWHYYHTFNNYPWNYWWRRPTWAVTSSWFAWTPPPTVWSEPIYYDYGSSGNVVYQDNSVYIDGSRVATSDEFAQSAAALATVEPPASEEEAQQAEWLPLGTFAVSTSESDVQPSQVVQLAVDKNGIVAGTLYNRDTDETQAVQGQVDKETQRVAFRLGASEAFVAETGLYNLTQDEAPLLVHIGKDSTKTYNLVRLEDSASESGDSND